jgi:hypothetical protein
MMSFSKNRKVGASRKIPPAAYLLKERIAANSPKRSESFWTTSQNARACSSGVGGRGAVRIMYCIANVSFLPERSPRRILKRECLLAAITADCSPALFGVFRDYCFSRRFQLMPWAGIYLFTTESKRPTNITTHDFSLFSESLQACIYKRERVFDSREVVTPRLKGISNFNRAHGLIWRVVNDRSNQVRPGSFRLYLLSKRVLKPVCCGL